MNVRIFWVRAMKCMCAQTRPRFILSSERVLGGLEFEPMLTPREKSPLPENVPRGGSNPRRCGQRAQALPTELFRPPSGKVMQLTLLRQERVSSLAFTPARSTQLPTPPPPAHKENKCKRIIGASVSWHGLYSVGYLQFCCCLIIGA